MDLPGFTFDVSYFKKRGLPTSCYDGEAVQFRVAKGGEQKFITLYNHHNGYYGKGFKFEVPVDPSRNKEDYV